MTVVFCEDRNLKEKERQILSLTALNRKKERMGPGSINEETENACNIRHKHKKNACLNPFNP